MRVGLRGIERDGALQSGNGFLIFPLLDKNRAEVHIREAQIVARLQGFLQQRQRRIAIILLEGHVAEIGQGLSIFGIDGELILEISFRGVVLLQLPMKIAEAEMKIGLAGRGVDGRLKFGNGIGSPAEAVESFSHEHVGGGRIGIVFEDSLKFSKRAGRDFGPDAALREDAQELEIRGIGIGSDAQRRNGVGKAFGAVIAKTEKRAGLEIRRIAGERGAKRSDGALETAILELSEAEIELDSRKLGIERQSFAVSGGGFGIFLQAGQVHAKAGPGASVAGSAGDDGLPDLRGVIELALLLESLSLGGRGDGRLWFGSMDRAGEGERKGSEQKGYPHPPVFSVRVASKGLRLGGSRNSGKYGT